MANTKIITLISNDEQKFNVPANLMLRESKFFNNWFENIEEIEELNYKLDSVNGETLGKIVEFLELLNKVELPQIKKQPIQCHLDFSEYVPKEYDEFINSVIINKEIDIYSYKPEIKLNRLTLAANCYGIEKLFSLCMAKNGHIQNIINDKEKKAGMNNFWDCVQIYRNFNGRVDNLTDDDIMRVEKENEWMNS
jgi:hypothetical protein